MLAADGVVAWFHGRSEFGPRALGHRSLLAHPGRRRTWNGSTTSRAGSSSGRSRRWCCRTRAADDLHRRPDAQPVHAVRARRRRRWRDRIPAVVHVDGTARIQTVDPTARSRGWPRCCERSSSAPDCRCVVNTSLNTAGRPMVDDPRDALECSAPPRSTRWPSARTWSVARDLFDPRSTDDGDTDLQYAVVIPTVGRPCLRPPARRAGRGVGPAPERGRGRRRPRRRRGAADAPRLRRRRSTVRVAARRRARPGRRAQRSAGGRAAHRGSRSWTTTCDVAAGLARRSSPPICGAAGADVGGDPGPIAVPLPGPAPPDRLGTRHRRPGEAPLDHRRHGLPAGGAGAAGGFDERFPRAFREDADLALRLRAAGWRLRRGRRDAPCTRSGRPRPGQRPRPGGQRRRRADAGAARPPLAGPGRGRPGPLPAAPGHRRRGGRLAGRSGRGGAVRAARPRPLAGVPRWLGLTAEFAGRADRPRPARRRASCAACPSPAPLIPPAAVLAPGSRADGGIGPWQRLARRRSRAVLFDRDGTLMHDVPYNGDPDAGRAGRRAPPRRWTGCGGTGCAVGVITNQSGIGRGLLTQGRRRGQRAGSSELLGPFDTWQVCPHAPGRRCALPQARARHGARGGGGRSARRRASAP